MSRALSKRRRRYRYRTGIARVNPTSRPAVSSALKWLGAGAVVGGTLGAIGSASNMTGANLTVGTIGGAASGVGLVSIGGLIVGLASPPNRNAGLATAGIGLAALIVTQLITTTTMGAKSA
jgi:hypothetical protein